MEYISSYRQSINYSLLDAFKYLNITNDDDLIDFAKGNKAFINCLAFSNFNIIAYLYNDNLKPKRKKNLAKTIYKYLNRFYFNHMPNNLWAYSRPVIGDFQDKLKDNRVRLEYLSKTDSLSTKSPVRNVYRNPEIIVGDRYFYLINSLKDNKSKWKLKINNFLEEVYLNTGTLISMSRLFEEIDICTNFEEFLKDIEYLVSIDFLKCKLDANIYIHKIIDFDEEEFINFNYINNKQLIQELSLNDNFDKGRQSFFINLYKNKLNICGLFSKNSFSSVRNIVSIFTLEHNYDAAMECLTKYLDEYYGLNTFIPLAEIINSPFFDSLTSEKSMGVISSQMERLIRECNDQKYEEVSIDNLIGSLELEASIPETFSVPIQCLENGLYSINLNKVSSCANSFDNRLLYSVPEINLLAEDLIIENINQSSFISHLKHRNEKFYNDRYFTDFELPGYNNIKLEEMYIGYFNNNINLYVKKEGQYKSTIINVPSMLHVNSFSETMQKLIRLFGRDAEFRTNILDRYSYQSFLPRIKYKEWVIRSKTWIYIVLDDDFSLFYEDFKQFIKKWKIPQIVEIFIAENPLTINIHSEYHIRKIFNNIKNGTRIIISEMLNTVDNYPGEFIFNYSSENQYSHIIEVDEDSPLQTSLLDTISYGIKWVYYSVKVSVAFQNEMLVKIYDLIESEPSLINFHFVRYTENNINTLRLRFELNNKEQSLYIIEKIESVIGSHIYSVNRFTPEINRYGGKKLFEDIYSYFTLDSMFVIKIIKNKKINNRLLLTDCLSYFHILSVYDPDAFIEIRNKYLQGNLKQTRQTIDKFINDNTLNKLFMDFYLSNMIGIISMLKELNLNERVDIYMSILHMHRNRLLNDNNYMDELSMIKASLYSLSIKKMNE